MKKNLIKPTFQIVKFEYDVITASMMPEPMDGQGKDAKVGFSGIKTFGGFGGGLGTPLQ